MDSVRFLLNDNWKFHLGEAEDAWYKGYDDASWEDCDRSLTTGLSAFPSPGNYSSGTGYLAGGIGWYRLRFLAPGGIQGEERFPSASTGSIKTARSGATATTSGKRPNGYVPVTSTTSAASPASGNADGSGARKMRSASRSRTRIWRTPAGLPGPASRERPTCSSKRTSIPFPAAFSSSTLYGDDGKSAQVEISHELVNETDRKAGCGRYQQP